MFEGFHEKVGSLSLRNRHLTHNLAVQALEPAGPSASSSLPLLSLRGLGLMTASRSFEDVLDTALGQQGVLGPPAWGPSREGPLSNLGACPATQIPCLE